ncbi:Glycosyl transferase family 2 [Paraburkholderia fungorum]|uniref:Glycosyl transferase family 2 n=1 Tax=Paraburkholderia fungorum TaxID=134537 RepID=A0A1H0YN48_9BURK|nr:glycosyltransferase [Paraburkholderia fungorum]SDQ16560.1 Glycosyl transferase family 2 [Paraburkholderia fungorum]
MIENQVDCIVRLHDVKRLNELERCVFSLVGQTYRPLNIIVTLQRFSPSDIAQVEASLARLLKMHDAPSLELVNFTSEEPKDARTELLNLGLAKASGQYVAFLDYDDVLYPEAYGLLVDQLKASNAAIAFSSVRVVHADVSPQFLVATRADSAVFPGEGLEDLFVANFCPIHSYLIDRSIASPELYFDTLLTWEEDYDLLLRITAAYPSDFELIGTVVGDYYIKSDLSNSTGVVGAEGKLGGERLLEYEKVAALIEARRRITRISDAVKNQLGLQTHAENLTIRSALRELGIDEVFAESTASGSAEKSNVEIVAAAPVHPNDDFFDGSKGHYESVGLQMAKFVERAAKLSGSKNPTILELPSSYGRNTRHLARKFKASDIHVADVMAPAVEFCRSTFGVHGHHLVAPLFEYAALENEKFDVAALASLIPHLSQAGAQSALKHFFSKIRSGGIAVVTTHGARSRERLGEADCYSVGEEARQRLLSSYDAGEYAFVDSQRQNSVRAKIVVDAGERYGISLIPERWLRTFCEENQLTIVERLTGGWDGNQDVYFIRK